MVLRMEDNLSPYLTMVETAEPTAPDAGQQRLYVDPVTHLLMIVDSTGAESSVAGSAVTRASLGLATSDTPQFTGIEVGHASDTTLARSAAGILTVEGNRIFAVGGADVPIADGGTGASTATAAFDALSPMTTAGDLIIGGASGTRTRLAAGATSGHVLTSNGAGVAPSYQAAAGGGSLSYQQTFLTSDVSIAATNTFYDGPAVTLSAGTWLIIADILFLDPNANGGILQWKIWDGTTVAKNGQVSRSGAEWRQIPSTSVVVVIASGTPSWKISVATTANPTTGQLIKAAGSNNISGNLASNISAVKIV